MEWKLLIEGELREIDRLNWRGQQGVIYSVSTISIRQEGGGEIPPAGGRRYLGALPGGPGKARERQLRPEAACLFPVPAPYESKLSTGPKPKTAGCFRNQLPFHCLAERARFELAIPFWGTHAFQACLFSHSSISPIRIPGNRDCKGNHFFRKCKYRRVNFSTRGYKVRLWSMQPGYSSG